jgi:HEAT repeats
MRLPRFRFHIRTLLLIVALVALTLVGQRIYLDGPEAHWLALMLRYGNVATRRAAADDARLMGGESIRDALDYVFRLGNPPAFETQNRRLQRRSDLLLPALAQAAKDSDAVCRARALIALHRNSVGGASESKKTFALHEILAGMGDADASVRAAAVGSLMGLADRDTGAVITALRTALADPSGGVRHAAALELGLLGGDIPATQPDVASILIPVLTGRDDSGVRIGAAWAMYFFGRDSRRRTSPVGPDVVPPLVAALHDRDVDVRRTAAVILGLRLQSRGRTISAWNLRRDSIIPALNVAITDSDQETRENSALALFTFGLREAVVIELIEQAARTPGRSQKPEFESALRELQSELVEERETILLADGLGQELGLGSGLRLGLGYK